LPVIDYIVREALDSEIFQVIFVLSENKKIILDYFNKNQRLEKLLKENGQKEEKIKILKEIEERFKSASFYSCIQQIPKGDGDALLKARKFIKKEPFVLMFPDDLFLSKEPMLLQMGKVFQTSGKPVVALSKKPKEKLQGYGVAEVEKIANRIFKIKRIVEKPMPGEEPSDLAVCGRYILTPDIFSHLLRTPMNKKNELIVAEAINTMIADGKAVYGYEIEGEWFECGRKEDWVFSNLKMCLRHPEYGPMLKEFLKKNL